MEKHKKNWDRYLSCCWLLTLLLITMMPLNLNAQASKNVSATIVDETGEPMIGVNVVIKGAENKGTVTDLDGVFVLNASSSDVLMISFIGYKTEEIKVSNLKKKIRLQPDTEMLDEVVVVGYGTQRRATMTGAVAEVKATEVIKSPVANMAQALTGRAPGLTTVQASGEPGADGVTLRIRGVGTLNNADPLVLVDGVERSFTQLDPNEIESISILKDAASTAVFGIRGANGVIVVTTKSGTEGPAKVSFSANMAVQQAVRMPERVDAETFCNAFNEALYNDSPELGKYQRFTAEEIETYKNQSNPLLYPEHNWIDELMNKSALQQNYNLTINGGTQNAKYFVSLGYFNQEGLLKDITERIDYLKYDNNTKYERYNLRSNVDFNVSPSTSLGVMIGAIIQNRKYAQNDPFMWMLGAPPIASPYIASGKLITAGNVADIGSSPYANITSGIYEDMKSTLSVTIKGRQKLDFLLKGLSLRGMVSYDSYYLQRASKSQSTVMYQPVYQPNALGETSLQLKQIGEYGTLSNPSESFDRNQKLHAEGAIEYQNKFGNHNVGALLIATLDKKWYVASERKIIPVTYSGVVARATYDYLGKYLLEFNMGYNGSENFPEENRFALFPAFSAGWNVAEEKFFQNIVNRDIISKLKIRGSYGIVGNDAAQNKRFMYISGVYSSGGGAYFGSSTQTWMGGYNEGRLGNNAVTWETAEKTNVGVELTMFKDMFSFNAEYFYDDRKDILAPLVNGSNQSAVEGQAIYNIGRVRNKGYEFSATWRSKINKFSYWLSGNYSFARNKVVFKDEIVDPLNPQLLSTGRRIGEKIAYVADGFYKDWDDVKRGPVYGSPQPGDVKYVDINGDGIINDRDRVPIGHPDTPEINYGFSGGFSYKGFDVSFLFQGTENTTKFFGESFIKPFSANVGILKYQYDERWTPETAETAKRPRLTKNYTTNSYLQSTVWLEDASYLKLRNLEIAYNINPNLLKKFFIKGMRIYVNGQNLFTWSPLKVIDPEGNPNNTYKYPQLRVYNFGLKLNF